MDLTDRAARAVTLEAARAEAQEPAVAAAALVEQAVRVDPVAQVAEANSIS